MSDARIQTAGAFDRTDAPIYFLPANAGWIGVVAADQHPYVLIAMNELQSEKGVGFFRDMIANGTKVFIDSGIFNLAMSHAREHGVTMDSALSMSPDEIDGFHDLYDRYVALIREYGDKVWGYVELDQGGIHNKRKTRAKLEAMGFRPIPVYHPINDGWDYFDELAEKYDRICVGNLVKAAPPLRRRLLATMYERRQKYPHLWIHLLGVTATEIVSAYPQQSCDSSSWLAGVRWSSSDHDTVSLRRFDSLPEDFTYVFGVGDSDTDIDSPGHMKAVAFAAMRAAMRQRNWRNMMGGLAAQDMDPRCYDR